MPTVFALIVIDMSQEQLYQGPGQSSIVPENWTGYSNILNLSKRLPKQRVFDSRLWMSPEDHSTLEYVCEVGRAETPGALLTSHLDGLDATFVKKVQYSGFFNSTLERLLRDQGVTDLLITGINTDFCVFATALDAFSHGFKIYLVEDACASCNGTAGHKAGINLFEHYFVSYGKVVSSSEALKLIGS